MKSIKLLAVAATAALFAACGGSKSTATTDSSTTVKTDSTTKMTVDTSMNDTTFATKAATGGMAEVALGKMAAMKTKDPQIKEFAKMMVMDHSKANDELLIIAKKN